MREKHFLNAFLFKLYAWQGTGEIVGVVMTNVFNYFWLALPTADCSRIEAYTLVHLGLVTHNCH